MNLNKVMAIANLIQDPEIRYTTDSKAFLTLRLAINTPYKDKNNEWQQQTVFIGAACWNNAEQLGEILTKGDSIFIEGSLQQRSWEKDGQKRSVIEIKIIRVQYIKVKKFNKENNEK